MALILMVTFTKNMRLFMKCIFLFIIFICSSEIAKGGIYYNNCDNQIYAAQLAAASMKYDRCSYKRIGYDLVGKCTTWDEKTKYERIERDFYKRNVIVDNVKINILDIDYLKNVVD